MFKYVIGALIGGIFGYFVVYRLIGCSDGACRITSSPYISTLYGIVFGVLIAGIIATPERQPDAGQSSSSSAAVYQTITAEEAKDRIDSGEAIVILDVRTEAEFTQGHIPNAVLLPNETITDTKPTQLPELDSEILIYCRSGNRSAHAAKKLIALGYTNVYDFGGIRDWPYDIETGY